MDYAFNKSSTTIKEPEPEKEIVKSNISSGDLPLFASSPQPIQIECDSKETKIANQLNSLKENNKSNEEDKKNNHQSKNLMNTVDLQVQKKQKLCITEDIYMIINLTSQITDEIKKNFEIIKDLPETTPIEIESRKIKLKNVEKKCTNKTLILDLDDTLVHTLNEKKTYSQKDLKNLEINSAYYIDPKKGSKSIAKYIIRPYALTFLQNIFPFYEIILFTASDQSYADSIIDKLDPEKNLIDYRLYRQHCISQKNQHIKNLNILENRELKNIIIVDNSIISFKDNFENGIYVPTFKGDSTDRELIKLNDFLKSKNILDAEDVRIIIHKEFPLINMYKIYKKSLTDSI